jgi:hypothetical protein
MRNYHTFLALIVLMTLAGLVMAADTAITVKQPTPSAASTVLTTGTAMKNGNPDVNYLLWPGDRRCDLILIANVTSVSDIDNTSPHITIKHGDNPPAFRSGIGDLDITTEAVGNYFIGPLESARFKNTTGYLEVYGTNLTGTISAVEVKRA